MGVGRLLCIGHKILKRDPAVSRHTRHNVNGGMFQHCNDRPHVLEVSTALQRQDIILICPFAAFKPNRIAMG